MAKITISAAKVPATFLNIPKIYAPVRARFKVNNPLPRRRAFITLAA